MVVVDMEIRRAIREVGPLGEGTPHSNDQRGARVANERIDAEIKGCGLASISGQVIRSLAAAAQ
jgi:hypothetical protein